jgi:hypothetical protein
MMDSNLYYVVTYQWKSMIYLQKVIGIDSILDISPCNHQPTQGCGTADGGHGCQASNCNIKRQQVATHQLIRMIRTSSPLSTSLHLDTSLELHLCQLGSLWNTHLKVRLDLTMSYLRYWWDLKFLQLNHDQIRSIALRSIAYWNGHGKEVRLVQMHDWLWLDCLDWLDWLDWLDLT